MLQSTAPPMKYDGADHRMAEVQAPSRWAHRATDCAAGRSCSSVRHAATTPLAGIATVTASRCSAPDRRFRLAGWRAEPLPRVEDPGRHESELAVRPPGTCRPVDASPTAPRVRSLKGAARPAKLEDHR